MHLHFSQAGRGLPARDRRVARARARRRVRRAARSRRPRQRERAGRGATRLGAPARAGRLGLHRLAAGVGRPRRLAHAAGDLPRGVRARARPRPPRPHRRGSARAHAAGLRDRRTEASLPAGDRARRGDLVPGLLGAERRLRPRERADAGPSRGRHLGDSTVRRSGPPGRSGPTGASCSAAATRRPPSTRGSPTCWCRCDSRGSRCARSCS